jgi:hypothetical protein
MTALWGHWQDSAGSQVPTTSWAGFNFASQIRNDSGSNLTKPNDSTVQVGEALPSGKAKFFVATIKFDQTRNNRGTAQGRFVLSSGTGNLFTTYATSYTRNSGNRTGWIKIMGVLTNCSEDAQVQVQWRSDTDAVTGGSISGDSDLQVSDLYFSEIGIYTDTTGNQAYGGTTRNTVTLNNNVQQTNTAAIERSGNTVTIKGNNKRYLILGSVAGDAGGSRTQRISNIAYAGTAKADTQVYAYQRNSANEFAGMALADIYETATTDIAVTLQCYRGAGVAADQGGADVDGSWNSTPGFNGLCVIELDDNAEVFRSSDATGLQTLSGVATVTLNSMRAADFNDSASYTRASNTVMNVEASHNMLCWSNIFTARNNIASGTRATIGTRITINGTDQSVGEHGNYTRGNQGSQDCFGGSFNAGAIFAVTANDDIGVESFDAGDNGGTDRTQAGTASFWALNLDTTEPAASGVTGTASITQAANTLSSAGDVAVAGTLSESQADNTLTAAGDVSITGTSSPSQADNTLTAEGDVSVSGTASIDQAADTLTASGGTQSSSTGDADITQADNTLSSSGDVLVDGDASLTNDSDTLSSSGGVSIAGSASITQAADTLSAQGDVSLSGTASVSQDANTATAAGSVLIDGTADNTQAGDSTASAGEVDVSGSLSITQDDNTLSASSEGTSTGQLDEQQDDNTISAGGDVDVSGSASISQSANTLSSAGTIAFNPITGELSVTQAGNSLSAQGEVLISGSLDESQDDNSVDSDADLDSVGGLTATQDNNTIVAAGGVIVDGQLAETQSGDTLSSSGEVRDVAFTNIALTGYVTLAVNVTGFIEPEISLTAYVSASHSILGYISPNYDLTAHITPKYEFTGYIE